MKALGRGLGAFALTDVEVRRSPGPGAGRGAPSLVLHGGAAALAGARGAGRLHLSLTHTTDVAIAFVVAEQSSPPAGRRARPRATRASRPDPGGDGVGRPGGPGPHQPRDPGAPRRDGGGARRAPCSWGAPTAAASSSSRARAPTAPTVGWPRRRWPAAARAWPCWRRAWRRRSCRRATWWSTPRTAPGSGAPTTRRDRRRAPPCSRSTCRQASTPTRATASGRAVRADATVTFAALKPGLLQGEGPERSGRVQVADIGIGFPVPRALLVEDADAALAAAPGARGQQVGPRRGGGRGLGRHGGRGHPVHPWCHGGRRGHGPPGTAGRPHRRLADRGGAHAPAAHAAGRARSWRRR